MAETYPHLQIQREEPITEKRPGGRPQFFVPNNPAEHGKQLREGWRQAKQKVDQEVGGFDDRKLFRFSVQKGFEPYSFKAQPIRSSGSQPSNPFNAYSIFIY